MRFSTDTEQRAELEIDVSLPTIGAFGSVALAGCWSVRAEARAFALEFDRFDGSMASFRVRLERDFGRHVSGGIGFTYYQTRLESQEVSNRGVYEATRYGPLVYVSMQF